MENFVLTEETMLNAKTYLPLSDKVSLAQTIAKLCIRETKTAEQNLIGESFLALPHLKEENLEKKEILLLNVLLSYYFEIEIKADDDMNPFEQYDFYMGDNVYNQLERFRSPQAGADKEKSEKLRIKAFDIIADFKMLRKMVDREIYNALAAENDTLARFMAAISVYADPESIKKAVEEITKISGEMKAKEQAAEN